LQSPSTTVGFVGVSGYTAADLRKIEVAADAFEYDGLALVLGDEVSLTQVTDARVGTYSNVYDHSYTLNAVVFLPPVEYYGYKMSTFKIVLKVQDQILKSKLYTNDDYQAHVKQKGKRVPMIASVTWKVDSLAHVGQQLTVEIESLTSVDREGYVLMVDSVYLEEMVDMCQPLFPTCNKAAIDMYIVIDESGSSENAAHRSDYVAAAQVLLDSAYAHVIEDAQKVSPQISSVHAELRVFDSADRPVPLLTGAPTLSLLDATTLSFLTNTLDAYNNSAREPPFNRPTALGSAVEKLMVNTIAPAITSGTSSADVRIIVIVSEGDSFDTEDVADFDKRMKRFRSLASSFADKPTCLYLISGVRDKESVSNLRSDAFGKGHFIMNGQYTASLTTCNLPSPAYVADIQENGADALAAYIFGANDGPVLQQYSCKTGPDHCDCLVDGVRASSRLALPSFVQNYDEWLDECCHRDCLPTTTVTTMSSTTTTDTTSTATTNTCPTCTTCPNEDTWSCAFDELEVKGECQEARICERKRFAGLNGNKCDCTKGPAGRSCHTCLQTRASKSASETNPVVGSWFSRVKGTPYLSVCTVCKHNLLLEEVTQVCIREDQCPFEAARYLQDSGYAGRCEAPFTCFPAVEDCECPSSCSNSCKYVSELAATSNRLVVIAKMGVDMVNSGTAVCLICNKDMYMVRGVCVDVATCIKAGGLPIDTDDRRCEL
jgi:hypothetical protein